MISRHFGIGLRRATATALIFGVIIVSVCQEAAASDKTPATGGAIALQIPADSINTEEAADRALTAAAQEKKDIDARFEAEQQDCRSKFLVTSCVADARERRRVGLVQARQIEVAANAFKRHARLAERNQALQERRLKDANEEAERAQRRLDYEVKVGKKTEAEENPAAPMENAVRKTPREPSVRPVPQLKARQRRQPQERQDQAEESARRAANVVAYEKKLHNAAQHQREIADKKLEKEHQQKIKDEQSKQK